MVRLQRPAAMNAISTDLLDELNLALDEIEADESVRVVVLTGTGRAFCAGADLKALANAAGEVDPSQVVEFVSYAARTIERLAALAQPVIAGVNGLALAGGLECCSRATSSWLRRQRASAMRMRTTDIPGAGGSVRLARVVGTQMAKYLAFTGGHFPASSPVLAGLVSEIVDPGARDPAIRTRHHLGRQEPAGAPSNEAPDQRRTRSVPSRCTRRRTAGPCEQCRSEDFAEGSRRSPPGASPSIRDDRRTSRGYDRALHPQRGPPRISAVGPDAGPIALRRLDACPVAKREVPDPPSSVNWAPRGCSDS